MLESDYQKKQKQALCSSLKTRLLTMWVITALIVVLLLIFVPDEHESGAEISFIASSIFVSIAGVITILYRYRNKEMFPTEAYWVLGVSFFFSFVMVGLLATDLAFTLKNRQQENLADQERLNSFMNVLWALVYWGNLLCGSCMVKFYQTYWVSGHFSRKSRVKFALRKLLLLISLMTALLVVAIIIGYVVLKDKFLPVTQASVLIINNVYGTFVLVLLLSYGLAFIPLYLWKSVNLEGQLYNRLNEADRVYSAFRSSRSEFLQQVSICKNLIDKHATAQNQDYLNVLLNEIPSEDLEGHKVYSSSNFTSDIQRGDLVDENVIAKRRHQLKVTLYAYKRKKMRWTALFQEVQEMVVKPVQFSEHDLTKKIQVIPFPNAELPQNRQIDLILKVADQKTLISITFKVLAVGSILWCLFLLANETAIMFTPNVGKSAIWALKGAFTGDLSLTFMVTVLITSGMILTSFFTIFRLKLSDFLQLEPGLTDCVTFCSFVGLFTKLIAVACFNYMIMAGEVQIMLSQGKDYPYQTSFVHFYAGMLDAPFLGDNFNYILPALILVFSILFIVLSCLKYDNKAINALRSYNERQSKKPVTAEDLEVNQETQPLKAKAEMTQIERILKGERAILKEIKRMRQVSDKKTFVKVSVGGPKQAGFKRREGILLPQQTEHLLGQSFVSSGQKIDLEGVPTKEDWEVDSQSSIASFAYSEDNPQEEEKHSAALPSHLMAFQKEDLSYWDKAPKKSDSGPSTPPFLRQGLQGNSPDQDLKKKSNLWRKSTLVEKQTSINMSQEESRQQFLSRKNTLDKRASLAINKVTRASFLTNKQGYVLKKSSKSSWGISVWQKRYIVLTKGKLLFFHEMKDYNYWDDQPHNPKFQPTQQVDLSHVTSVNFHYDTDAPVKSKKLFKHSHLEETRFDIYTPTRVYNLKIEGNDMDQAVEWVAALQESLEFFA